MTDKGYLLETLEKSLRTKIRQEWDRKDYLTRHRLVAKYLRDTLSSAPAYCDYRPDKADGSPSRCWNGLASGYATMCPDINELNLELRDLEIDKRLHIVQKHLKAMDSKI